MANKSIVDAIVDSLVFQASDDGLTGVIHQQSGKTDAFERTLPKGITPDTVEKVFSHLDEFAAASAEAFRLLAVDEFKSHERLKRVHATTAMSSAANSQIEAVMYRDHVRADQANPGQTITEHGYMRVGVKTPLSGAISTEIDAFKDAMSEAFKK